MSCHVVWCVWCCVVSYRVMSCGVVSRRMASRRVVLCSVVESEVQCFMQVYRFVILVWSCRALYFYSVFCRVACFILPCIALYCIVLYGIALHFIVQLWYVMVWQGMVLYSMVYCCIVLCCNVVYCFGLELTALNWDGLGWIVLCYTCCIVIGLYDFLLCCVVLHGVVLHGSVA